MYVGLRSVLLISKDRLNAKFDNNSCLWEAIFTVAGGELIIRALGLIWHWLINNDY